MNAEQEISVIEKSMLLGLLRKTISYIFQQYTKFNRKCLVSMCYVYFRSLQSFVQSLIISQMMFILQQDLDK